MAMPLDVFVMRVTVDNRVISNAPITVFALTENVFVMRIKDTKDSSARTRAVQAGHLIAMDMAFVT